MLNRPSKAVVTRVVGTVGALVALWVFLALSASAPDSALAHDPAIVHVEQIIAYAENGTVPVRTFTSKDPEGKGIIWDVTGLDAHAFKISTSGVLEFMKAPNYEKPSDKARDGNVDGDIYGFTPADMEADSDTPSGSANNDEGDDHNNDGDYVDLGVSHDGDEDFTEVNGLDNNGDGEFDGPGIDYNGDGDFNDPGVDNNNDGDIYNVRPDGTPGTGDDSGVDENEDGDFNDAGDTLPDVHPDVPPDVMVPDMRPDVLPDETGDDNDYLITVRATEMRGQGETRRALSTEVHLTIRVMDRKEDPKVELEWLQPEVRTPITAMLSDPDLANESPVSVEWHWYSAKVSKPEPNNDNHWQDGKGSGSSSIGMSDEPSPPYVPHEDESGPVQKLRAVATYTVTLEDDLETASQRTDRKEWKMGVSVHPLRAEVTTEKDGDDNPENSSPDFPDNDTNGNPIYYFRTVSEDAPTGTEVGAPVVADDPDLPAQDPNQADILTYTLEAATDLNGAADGTDEQAKFAIDDTFFSIDKDTGQIRVKKALDRDTNQGRGDEGVQAAAPGVYVMAVSATDPSGETNTERVTINAEYANEPPIIKLVRNSMVEIRVNEADGDDHDADGEPDYDPASFMYNIYDATDGDNPADQAVWQALQGTDAAVFKFERVAATDNERKLEFKEAPDYETPGDDDGDNVYHVTLVARDNAESADSEARMDIVVFVDNVQETGEAMLSSDTVVGGLVQPLIGDPLTATLDDPDGSVTILRWQWYKERHREDEVVCVKIGEAPVDETGTVTTTFSGAAAYESTEIDGTCVSFPFDLISQPIPVTSGVMDDPVNGVTMSHMYTPTAQDDGRRLRAVVIYTDALSPDDDSSSTQYDERVASGVDGAGTIFKMEGTLVDNSNYPRDHANRLYKVVVTSELRVRESLSGTGGPEFAQSQVVREVAENAETGTIVGDPVTISKLKKLKVTYSLDETQSGHDQYFEIDDYGQIRVGTVDFPPDGTSGIINLHDDAHPHPIAANNDDDVEAAMDDPDLDFEDRTKKVFGLTVTATDGQDRTASIDVEVRVQDLNESPVFHYDSRDLVYMNINDGLVPPASKTIMHTEGDQRRVALFAASDPDNKGIIWEVTGTHDNPDPDAIDGGFDPDDANDFAITGGVLSFMAAPNYEKPTDANKDNVYTIVIKATEMEAVGGGPAKSAELPVTVMVENKKEPGKAILNWQQPEVGTPIMAETLTDPDGDKDRGFQSDGTQGTDSGFPISDMIGLDDASNTGGVDSDGTEIAGDISADDITFQWYRSTVFEPIANDDNLMVHWTVIDGADGRTYTPQGTGDLPETTNTLDVGEFLMVQIIYTDNESEGQTPAIMRNAYAKSAHPVRADVLPDENKSPEFTRARDTRSVPENTAVGQPVGRPVTVNREPDSDILTYTIEAATFDDPANDADVANGGAESQNQEFAAADDTGYFTIDKATGQIMVAKALDFDSNQGRGDETGVIPDGLAEDGVYIIVVRATDPSNENDGIPLNNAVGDQDSDSIQVVITVTDVDEKPVVDGPDVITVSEKDSGKLSSDKGYYVDISGRDANDSTVVRDFRNFFSAFDEEAEGVTLTLAGPDAQFFVLDQEEGQTGRGLYFKQQPSDYRPDYENPADRTGGSSVARDNVYEVTVVATEDSIAGDTQLRKEKKVRIVVNNLDEKGELSLDPAEPDKNDIVTASLTDWDGIQTERDGMETITSWYWYMSNADVVIHTYMMVGDNHHFRSPDGKFFRFDENGRIDENGDPFNVGVTPPAVPTLFIAVNAAGNFVITGATGRGDEIVDATSGAPVRALTAADEFVADPPVRAIVSKVPSATTNMFEAKTVGQYLHALVTYRDGASVEDDPVTALDERNDDPETVYNAQDATDNIETDYDSDRMLVMRTAKAVRSEAGPKGSPMFSEDVYVRHVAENTPHTGYVGMPVVFTDGVVEDEMLGDDGRRFGSGMGYLPASNFPDEPAPDGQVWVGLSTDLDYEDVNKNTFVVELTLQRDEFSDTATMTIMVEDINEAPTTPMQSFGLVINGPEVLDRFELKHGDSPAGYNRMLGTYATSGAAGRTVTWKALGGPDADDFTFANGVLTLSAVPDYETPTDADGDNEYLVTLAADDGVTVANPELTVIVRIQNVDEAGMLTLTPANPGVGTPVMASLTDMDSPDGVPDPDISWTWSRADAMAGPWNNISGEMDASYTPVAADDEGKYLRATARYTDGHGPGKVEMAETTSAVGQETVPMFADTTTTREVAENTAAGGNVGAPVSTTDGDGDTLTYTLMGTDATSFAIDTGTGQITVGAATTLDHETKASYKVTVGVTDGKDAGGNAEGTAREDDSIAVTITVTDVDDAVSAGLPGDTNNDGMIDKLEVIAAFRAYVGDPSDKTEMIAIFRQYVADSVSSQ